MSRFFMVQCVVATHHNRSFSEPTMPTHNWLFSEPQTFGGTQHYLQSDVTVLHFTRYM